MRVGLISLVILLLAGTTVPFDRPNRLRVPAGVSLGGKQSPAGQQKKFDCLPKDVQPDEVVSYGMNKRPNVTVEKKLTEMKAHCLNGKLVDAKDKEIRFFRVSCWGNPPADYLETQQREHAELEKLKKRYTVIVMGCNPMIQ